MVSLAAIVWEESTGLLELADWMEHPIWIVLELVLFGQRYGHPLHRPPVIPSCQDDSIDAIENSLLGVAAR